ncbi:MAG: ATP-dependent helicase HrpB [Pseudomonadota bacterium]
MPPQPFPIDDVLPALTAALTQTNRAVLAAPPGAGKTTRVPLALLGASWAQGRIVMLEPRRLAARAAAERMAETLDEKVGQSVGYRIRGESRVGKATRIEVVTEGILTRFLQADPDLPGIAAVIFDEIHERSIHSDLGLALTLECQAVLRPDLRVLAMSATLETQRLAALFGGAPVIESAGRMFPVETRWRNRPWQSGSAKRRLEDAAADLIAEAMDAVAEGDALVFLPGAGEIERVAARLDLPGVAVRRLHGALPFAEQRAALTPDPKRRRVVLSTAIAETSLTVEGVRIVIDAGRARRPRRDVASGMSRLVTVPVSRAEAEQRRGRAGRLGPGICYRLWTKGEEGALPAYPPPEILEADLAPLALDLAAWGAEDPAAMAFLDPPPAAGLAEARALLADLGALDADGRITPHGRTLARLAAHPRLAHMLLAAEAAGQGHRAAQIAACLGERDPLRAKGRPPADLSLRLRALDNPQSLAAETPYSTDGPALARIRAEAKRLRAAISGHGKTDPQSLSPGALLARAYPDRIGLRRPGDTPRFLLSGGRGARLDPADPLAGTRLLVAAEVEDTRPEATIRLAAPLAETELRALFQDRIRWRSAATWSRRNRQVEARQQERFGAITLADRIWRDAPPEALGAALAEGVCDLGLAALPWPDSALALRARIVWLRRQGDWAERLPDLSDPALTESLDRWLTPHLAGLTRLDQIRGTDLLAALDALVDWDTRQAADRAAPAVFATPLGGRVPIDYARAEPVLSIRVQELFGVTEHPTVGTPPLPLVVELLSPAGRPVQTTRDLPGFWASSYADVRKDMRARYPKHPWPENPTEAEPTRRAKPRR